jgi:hypothetical protein
LTISSIELALLIFSKLGSKAFTLEILLFISSSLLFFSRLIVELDILDLFEMALLFIFSLTQDSAFFRKKFVILLVEIMSFSFSF